jgi:small subunit ribosomal protein S6e
MKYNISNPTTGQNLVKEIDDDKINRHFNDRRMGSDVDGEVIGEEFKGYTLRITGGNDKQGFAMKQGILVNARIKILLRKKTTLYRPRRTGERKRKSVRGCICGPDLAVIFLRVLEKGIGEVTGLTDKEQPRRLGPKRANHIRSAFALRKKDDVRKYIVSRAIEKKVKKKGDEATEIEKTFYKSPKIQRLITEKRLRRKKLNAKSKKDKWASAKEAHVAYEKLLSKFLKEKKAAYKESHQSKPEEKKPAAPVTPAKPAKAAKAEVKKEAPKAKPEKTKGKK